MTLGALATLCAGIFFGAALYVSLVEHPAALEAERGFAGRFFVPMYRRAAPMQGGLALIGCVAGLGAWWEGAGRAWLLGGLVLAAVLQLTAHRIKPFNDRLMAKDRDVTSAETIALLEDWGLLHSVRTALGGMAFFLYLWALVRT